MGDLSVTTIAALAAGGAVLIAAFFAGVVSVVTTWNTIASKVSAIEGHVNSEKTAADGRETTLRRENELLREIIADSKQEKSLLAQSVVSKGIVTALAAPVPVEVVNTPLAVNQSKEK